MMNNGTPDYIVRVSGGVSEATARLANAQGSEIRAASRASAPGFDAFHRAVSAVLFGHGFRISRPEVMTDEDCIELLLEDGTIHATYHGAAVLIACEIGEMTGFAAEDEFEAGFGGGK